MTTTFNPYQAPSDGDGKGTSDTGLGSVSSVLELHPSKKFLREAARRYLLWRHGFVLTVFSLIAILGGSALTVYLDRTGSLSLFAGQPLLALIVALIYQGIVRDSRLKSEAQLRKYGLLEGTLSRLWVNQPTHQIVLQNSTGEHHWNLPVASAFPWRRGWILCFAKHEYIPISKRDIEDAYGNDEEFRREFVQVIRPDRS